MKYQPQLDGVSDRDHSLNLRCEALLRKRVRKCEHEFECVRMDKYTETIECAKCGETREICNA